MKSPSPYNQEHYLQRKPTQSESSLFDWLFCCSGPRQVPNEEATEMKKPTTLAKRPLKTRGTQLNSQSRIHVQENAEVGVLTERKNLKSTNTQTMKMSLFEQPQPHRESTSDSQVIKRTCKVRFSYAGPCNQGQSMQNSKESYRKTQLSETPVKETLKILTQKRPLLTLPIVELMESVEYAPPAGDSTNTSEITSPVSFGRKDSIQSPKQKRGKKLPFGRFSLKMRQVESIRQPEDDSDHESIVVKDDNEGLFGLLSPIREVEKQSRLEM